MAKKEIIKKIKSIDFHQFGVPLQQVAEQLCIKKIKGVAIQCTRQSVLAMAPILSDFWFSNIIYNSLMQLSCKYINQNH